MEMKRRTNHHKHKNTFNPDDFQQIKQIQFFSKRLNSQRITQRSKRLKPKDISFIPLDQIIKPTYEVRVQQYLHKLDNEDELVKDPILSARLGLLSPKTDAFGSIDQS